LVLMTTRDSVGRAARIAAGLRETAGAHERMAASSTGAIAAAADAVIAALRDGHTVLVFGNGGSAADAQHFAAELVGRFVADRQAFRAVALAANVSLLTAVSNDYGFERAFARQIEALGRPGDIALGISTSGRSSSVLRALETARAMGLTTIALTGRDGGDAGRLAEIHVNVPEPTVARVQEVHATVLHLICELVDEELGRFSHEDAKDTKKEM